MDLLPIVGAALAAGVASAPHCAGMCGPLALSACGARGAPTAAYLSGRVLSYALGGAAVGALGGRFVMLLGRAHVHHVAAAMAAMAMLWQAARLLRSESRRAAVVPLRSARRAGVPRGLGMGLLTGLLPCGALASAMLLAASAATPLGGAASMTAFAAASAPGLLAVVFAGRLASRIGLRAPGLHARRALGVALIALAAWTAARPFRVARQGCHCHDRASVSTTVERVRGTRVEVL